MAVSDTKTYVGTKIVFPIGQALWGLQLWKRVLGILFSPIIVCVGLVGGLCFLLLIKPIKWFKTKCFGVPPPPPQQPKALVKITENIYSAKRVFYTTIPITNYMWLCKTKNGVVVMNPDPKVELYGDLLREHGLEDIKCIVMVNVAHDTGAQKWKAVYKNAECLVPKKAEQYKMASAACDATGTIEDEIGKYGIVVKPYVARENVGIDYHWLLPSSSPEGNFLLLTENINRNDKIPDDTSVPLNAMYFPPGFFWISNRGDFKKGLNELSEMAEKGSIVGVGGLHFQGSINKESIVRELVLLAKNFPVW